MPARLHAFYSDSFVLPLPPEHRFPIRKYSQLRERLEGLIPRERIVFCVPPAASDEELRRVHTDEYLDRLISGTLSKLEQRRIGFPWSPEMVERSRRSTGATIQAAHQALSDRVAVNLAGGTHHAFPGHGQGYCVFNDVAVAIRTLQALGLIHQAVVIDCDVHQGNGTAAIFRDDASVFTCSLHGEKNFPFTKCDGDLDVAFPDGTSDERYLSTLNECLARHLPLETADMVFYLAGADPFAEDRLGRLKLTKSGLKERDRLVVDACFDRQLPLVVTMAGGYAPELSDIVDIHATTVTTVMKLLD